MNCELCQHNPASLFLIVEQFDGSPKGTNATKAHACTDCFGLLMTMDVRYHGLRVTEVSQQDYNAHIDPPLPPEGKRIGIYSRPSICGCGFPVLKTDIPTGIRYVCGEDEHGYTFTCGGCAKSFPVRCCFAQRESGNDKGGMMPVDLFDFSPLAQAFNPDDTL